MRRRDLQTIQLKLAELKEYEQAKAERYKTHQPLLTPRAGNPDSDVPLPSSSVPAVLLANAIEEDTGKTSSSTR